MTATPPSEPLTSLSDTDGFGRTLLSVSERDVDLLLLEEFHVAPEFVAWFCQQLSIANARLERAWHSVSDGDGETDLLLRVRSNGARIGVLIENKVAAAEQPDQDVRYHLRGLRGQETGRFDRYVTCMCAPAVYLSSLSAESRYQHRVSYESIRDWFSRQTGARAAWRSQFLTEAIDQGRRGYTLVPNMAKSEFHVAYWTYLQQKHPALLMNRPALKGSFSDWIIVKTSDMPKGVTFDHKNQLGCLDLTFAGRRIEELRSLKADWPAGIVLTQKAKSAVASSRVPIFDMTAPFSGQEDKMEQVVAAMYVLAPYSRIFETS